MCKRKVTLNVDGCGGLLPPSSRHRQAQTFNGHSSNTNQHKPFPRWTTNTSELTVCFAPLRVRSRSAWSSPTRRRTPTVISCESKHTKGPENAGTFIISKGPTAEEASGSGEGQRSNHKRLCCCFPQRCSVSRLFQTRQEQTGQQTTQRRLLVVSVINIWRTFPHKIVIFVFRFHL